jgi:phosphatidylglycerophosphatase A
MRTIATLGPIGFSPKGPGTLASLVGLVIMWLLSPHVAWQAAGCLIATLLGFWSAGPTSRALGGSDHQAVVIDEVAGMMVALAALPATWKIYLAGLLLFRFFDIVKPPPIRQLQRLPGSLGIVLDDLLAGLATQLSLRALFLLTAIR